MRSLRHVALAAVAVGVVALGPTSEQVTGQGASTPPILLVLNNSAGAPYGNYLAEILRAEGINSFATAQLSTLPLGTLDDYRLAILAETTLSAAQATMFTSYVSGGGRLVAMRPNALLNGLLGITSTAGTTTNGYLEIVQSGPGAGLNAATLPIKGTATNYALAGGAAVVGRLFSDNDSATAFPAAHRFNNTATWSFDLARSVAFVRQGDPANTGEQDGLEKVRTSDLFFGEIDKARVNIPHADIQMRLFARVIESLLEGSTPLPRLWYFPGASRTLMVVTADTHTTTVAAHDVLFDLVESMGGRASLYIGRWLNLPATAVAGWAAAGHEVGLHPYFADDGFANDFDAGYDVSATWFEPAMGFPY